MFSLKWEHFRYNGIIWTYIPISHLVRFQIIIRWFWNLVETNIEPFRLDFQFSNTIATKLDVSKAAAKTSCLMRPKICCRLHTFLVCCPFLYSSLRVLYFYKERGRLRADRWIQTQPHSKPWQFGIGFGDLNGREAGKDKCTASSVLYYLDITSSIRVDVIYWSGYTPRRNYKSFLEASCYLWFRDNRSAQGYILFNYGNWPLGATTKQMESLKMWNWDFCITDLNRKVFPNNVWALSGLTFQPRQK